MIEATVRRAKREDRERLGALWQAFLEEQAALDDRFLPADDALERWRNDFDERLRDRGFCLVVAEQAGDLVGFASAERWTPPPIYTGPPAVHLNELFVVPAARGAGLGRQLVEAVTAWAAEIGAGQIRLGVLAANAAGRGFWERLAARPFSMIYTIGVEAGEPPRKKYRLGF